MLTLRPTVCFKATSLNKVNTQTPFDVFLAEVGNIQHLSPKVSHLKPETRLLAHLLVLANTSDIPRLK